MTEGYGPIKKTDIGKTFCVCDSTPHSFIKNGVALLGKELAIVLLMMVNMVNVRTDAFFNCRAVRRQLFPYDTTASRLTSCKGSLGRWVPMQL